MNWLIKTAFALLLSAFLFAGFLVVYMFFGTPGTLDGVEVRVEQGEPFASVVRKLGERGLIGNEKLFLLWGRLTGADKRIHRGVYRFDASMPPREILHHLVTGKGVILSVTIPEGLTIKEVADLLGKMQIVDRDKFLALTADPEFLTSLGLAGVGLEGYLFPNTYHFAPMTPEKDIIMAMAEQFRRTVEPLLSQRDGSLELSSHEIVTLASIIEKETGIEAERPLVSAVFHNRLKRNMPLQSDPTVIYGLKEFDGRLTRKDLREPTPYNTYRIPALPPGPICNPGLASLKAALQPADVPYLFFVSKNDGTHLFSETLESHNQAVRIYQAPREPRAAERKRPAQ